MSEIAIKFENISKQYRLGMIGTGTISHDLNRWWIVNVLGKEDPYLKIGQANDQAAKADGNLIWALKNIDLEVKQGEVLGIIGKNGAGKSTLLKILSRVTTPTTGRITAYGRIASLLEVGTGFHPEMTGRENIYMNGSIMGMTKSEITRKLDEIVEFAGVAKYIDTPVKRYSSGMTVRLGFAIAAHLEPEILVVDEVLAVGDAEFQKKAIGKIQDISSGHGRTVLFVSHNMSTIKNLCTNGIILKDGSINFQGKIDQVINKYLSEQEIRSQKGILDITNRRGNGSLRFTHVEFRDKDNRERKTFEVGEELHIKVFFTITEKFLETITSRIDIGINDMYDKRVTWLSTNLFSDRIIHSKKHVIFKIPKLLLNEGGYNINLYCETSFGVTDWVTNIAKLNVVFHDFYGTGRTIPINQGSLITDFILL